MWETWDILSLPAEGHFFPVIVLLTFYWLVAAGFLPGNSNFIWRYTILIGNTHDPRLGTWITTPLEEKILWKSMKNLGIASALYLSWKLRSFSGFLNFVCHKLLQLCNIFWKRNCFCCISLFFISISNNMIWNLFLPWQLMELFICWYLFFLDLELFFQ